MWGKQILHMIIMLREAEHSPVFRQSSELCLIWLYDIPHILHRAQRPGFALMLTSLPSDAPALTPPWLSCRVLFTNSLTNFTSSLPTHASSCIHLLFVSLLLRSLLSCFILPYPANLTSLLSLPPSPACYTSPNPPSPSSSPAPVSYSFFLPPFPPPWRSALMQRQRARPCLITLIKHPVR